MPGAALPSITRLEAWVDPPAGPEPVLAPVMTGASGAAESIITFRAVETSPWFPALSVQKKLNSCSPSESVSLVKLHLPSTPAITVPTTTPSCSTETIDPGSATPSRRMALAEVSPSPFAPVSSPNPASSGFSGANVSMVQFPSDTLALSFPATSVNEIESSKLPSLSELVSRLKVPSWPATASPTTVSVPLIIA